MEKLNNSLLYLLCVFICEQITLCNLYVIVEPVKTGVNLISNNVPIKLLEDQQLYSVLNDESANSKHRRKESVAFGESQTFQEYENSETQKFTFQKSKRCPGCDSYQLPQQILKEESRQRLEYIKQQILYKLGMDKVPNAEKKNIDNSLYLQLLESSSLNNAPTSHPTPSPLSEETDKLFLFPVTKKFNTPTFNLSKPTLSLHPVKKITLFIKQELSSSYLVNSYLDQEIALISAAVPKSANFTPYEDISSMRVLGLVNPQINSDININLPEKQSVKWLQYDVTELLEPELVKGRLISIDSSDEFEINTTFMILEYDYSNIQRTKRSVDCNSIGNSSSCCRESFYVNFTHIGWDNWILQPAGYYANYCKGKCDISHARYHHTSVIGKYPSLISLCCSPREMSHISLIYLDENNVVFQKNLANMVVESCDCA